MTDTDGPDLWDDVAGGSIERTTLAAITEARAKGIIGVMDAGACAAILRLAQRMDYADFPYFGEELEKIDNVTEALFLKYATSLGLNVAGRVGVDVKTPQGKGKLGQLRAVEGGRTGGAARRGA